MSASPSKPSPPGTRHSAAAAGLLLLSAALAGCDPTGPVEPITFGEEEWYRPANSANGYKVFLPLEPGEQVEAFNGRDCQGRRLETAASPGGAVVEFTLMLGQQGVIELSARRLAADGGQSICSTRNAEVHLSDGGEFLSAGTLLTETAVSDAVSTGPVAVLLAEQGDTLWVTDGMASQTLPLNFQAATLEGISAGEAYAMEADAGTLWAVRLDGGGAQAVAGQLDSAASFFEVGGEVLFRGCGPTHCGFFRRSSGAAVPVTLAEGGEPFDAPRCLVHQAQLYCAAVHPVQGTEVWRYDPQLGQMTRVTDLAGAGGAAPQLTSTGEDLLLVSDQPLALWAVQTDGGVTSLDAGAEVSGLSLLGDTDAAVVVARTPEEGRALTLEEGTLREVALLPASASVIGTWRDELIYATPEGPPGFPWPTWRLNLGSAETTPAPAVTLYEPTITGDFLVSPLYEGDLQVLMHFSAVANQVVDLETNQARIAHRPGLFSDQTIALAGERLLFAETRGPDTGVLSVGPQELEDLSGPTITCPGDVTATRQTYATGEVVAYDGADAGDSEGPVRVWYSKDPGFFPLGETPVTVYAVDRGGNTARCSFTVTVE